MSILGNPICMPIGGKAAKGSNLFLAVSLPRSIYYEQAAEWLKIKDDPKTAIAETQWDGQVVCGNSLWLLYGNHAYAYSLEDGELLEDVELTGASGNSCNAICTDGVSRIWFVRYTISNLTLSPNGPGHSNRTYSKSTTLYLYQFNTGTKAVDLLTTQTAQISGSFYNNSESRSPSVPTQPTVTTFPGCGLIGYSSLSNNVYFGALAYRSIGGQIRYYTGEDVSAFISVANLLSDTKVYQYDLESNQASAIADIPTTNSFRGRYFYDDENFFYVGNGYTNANKEKTIYRYNKLSNTWESITTAFEGYTVGPFSYVQLGDKMLQISQTATGIFDPTTGNLDQASVPTVPPDNTVIYPGFKAYANNILYLVTAQGVYKCPFFSEVPADAPIVAKIYKGQKYHTLEPFSIPNKVNFTRTQQVATQDIEIKMYEYASEGGQTIYIEDTGEDA